VSELYVIGKRRRSLAQELGLVGATFGKLALVILAVVALRYGLMLAQSGLH
jgi:hypothetical protein